MSAGKTNRDGAFIHEDLNLTMDDHQQVVLWTTLTNERVLLVERDERAGAQEGRRNRRVACDQSLGTQTLQEPALPSWPVNLGDESARLRALQRGSSRP